MVQVSSISGSDTDSDDEPSVSGRAATQKSSQLMFKTQGNGFAALLLLVGDISAQQRKAVKSSWLSLCVAPQTPTQSPS